MRFVSEVRDLSWGVPEQQKKQAAARKHVRRYQDVRAARFPFLLFLRLPSVLIPTVQ
jgi:hypothetical protein